jgi:HAD superfamily hydrolase (TIGR01509 family)
VRRQAGARRLRLCEADALAIAGARRACDTEELAPYDAILFDFDGVLVDSEPIHYAAWMEALAPFGIRMDWPTYVRTCVGVSDRHMIERLAVQHGLTVDELWRAQPVKRAIFIRRMAEDAIFVPETLALVRELAARRLAVVSSSLRDEVAPPLARGGILECFATLVCGWEAGKIKPAPEPYLLAAERLGARRPLVVEDSEAGRRAGEAAGFEVLVVGSPREVAARVRQQLERRNKNAGLPLARQPGDHKQ